MPRATDAQRRQRELAWLLFQLRGARGNISPQVRSQLPDSIYKRLRSLCNELEEIDKLVQAYMQYTSERKSFRLAAAKPQKGTS